jgi:hypothetical protein
MENDNNFGTFSNEWLFPSLEELNTITWRVSEDAQARILAADYSVSELISKQRQAVVGMKNELGDNPFVALSGGIDSQAACLILKQCGVPFTAAIMEFNDELNKHDVESAKAFCSMFAIPYVTINFNILEFLSRSLASYVEKYDCPSPQLTAHCRLFEMIIEQHSPSSIIAGGNPPCIRDGKWEFISSRSHTVWMTFAKLNKYPLIGNFLGYSLDIALPFMVLQPDMPIDPEKRYKAKVSGMRRCGIPVVPQKQKFTGFELVKKHFENMTGDGWSFEKLFRLPHHTKRPEYDSVFDIPDTIHKFLSEQHSVLNKPRDGK